VQAPAFREWLRATGTVDRFAARALVTLPYPTRWALWEACSLPGLPYVWMTNRMFIIQWQEEGRTKTFLAEPSDYELGTGTPYIRWSIGDGEGGARRLQRWIADRAFTRYPPVLERLAELGIRPEEVDYVAFDHLHTQDIRRVVGTRGPAPDLGHPDSPVPPMFPNARLIVQRDELEHVRHVHPFQSRFHQPWTYDDLREDAFMVVDGDLLVAPGLALVRTAGHTLGNHTLVVNTERGIFTSSENGVAAECYAPELSRIPGLRAFAERWGIEVILNFNTPEYASWQYNSMVKEKLMADPVPGQGGIPQVFPSSELTRHPAAPHFRPTFEHGDITVGTFASPTAGPAAGAAGGAR
ncbi:MAG: hypothetical protein QOI63_89, partial [Thermoplasmata archaeon]|nr:hypothetical protein [Thermoplasmata archaeon]